VPCKSAERRYAAIYCNFVSRLLIHRLLFTVALGLISEANRGVQRWIEGSEGGHLIFQGIYIAHPFIRVLYYYLWKMDPIDFQIILSLYDYRDIEDPVEGG
jgi:hypothetical protein